MNFYILSLVLLSTLYGLIQIAKYILHSEEFECSFIAETIIKAGIALLWLLFAYVGLTTLGILFAPLLERINAAFFAFIDKFIPVAVLVGVGYALLRDKFPKSFTDNKEVDPVEVGYAEQEAEELHDDLRELIFNAVLDAAESTPFHSPRDAAGIEIGREKPYRMDGTMAIHQFCIDIDGKYSAVQEGEILTSLQRHINQRAKSYPQLCRGGYAPFIYAFKNNGNFVIIEIVLFSDNYKEKIKNRRYAHIARRQAQERPTPEDPLFK